MYVIYALVDPRDNAVRYVGITDDVYKRFLAHINCNGSNFAKNTWILELRAANKMVIMKTLEEVETRDQALAREACWIKRLEMINQPIVNIIQRSSPRMAKETNLRSVRKAVLEMARVPVSPSSPMSIEEMFFDHKMGINAIVRELSPQTKGGDKFQRLVQEITDTIRNYVVKHGIALDQASQVLTEREMGVVSMFVEKRMNPGAIARELSGGKGGDAFQKASVEVAETIRKYIEVQMQ